MADHPGSEHADYSWLTTGPKQVRRGNVRLGRCFSVEDSELNFFPRSLVRAESLLRDTSAWNRADDRECQDDEATGKRSLFCALQKACIDVLGSYDQLSIVVTLTPRGARCDLSLAP